MPWCSIIYRSSELNFIKKLLKRKGYCCSFFIFWTGSQVMHEWCLELKEGEKNHQTQWPVSPHLRLDLLMELRDVACWAEDVVFVAWPPGPPSNSQWNSMNNRVWTVKYCTLFWDFFHSSHFMRRMVFYVFKSNIS